MNQDTDLRRKMEEEEKLRLENFRNELDEKVLERGWMYFSNGWVREPRELMPGYFEAMVEEVNPHAVSYSKEEDGTFSDIFCTCGDPAHSICRHMAAVLYLYESREAEEARVKTWDDLENETPKRNQ